MYVFYMELSCIVCWFQVERRVVSQLAVAYEKQLITDGCSLQLTVDNANCDHELTKSKPKRSLSVGKDRSLHLPSIKLQVVTGGQTANLQLDDVATM